MVTVIKGNTLLEIPENRKEDYLNRGYSIANNAGTVIKQAVPTDNDLLRKSYTDQKAVIANLQKQLAAKDEELEALKAELEELKGKQALEATPEEKPAPKKSTRSKKAE